MPNPSKTLGIDFGTSNTSVGYQKNGQSHLVEVEPDQKTLPTAVFFDFDAQATQFGTPAISALIDGEFGRFMRALKSVLGTSLMREKRQFMSERLDFIDIIGKFLAEIKQRAETASGQKFCYALCGRPVHFHSEDRQKDSQALLDLRECYLKAGFEDVKFMFEPEAAALANHKHLTSGSIGLIIDIGGGTSDFSLFKTGADGTEGIDIIASHGVRVGGTDFDRKISIDHVMPLLGKGSQIRNFFGSETITAPNAIFHNLATWEKIPFLYNGDTRRDAKDLEKFAAKPELLRRLTKILSRELGHDLAFAVEAGKINANKSPHAQINMAFLEKGLSAPLTAQQMQVSLAGLTHKINTCAAQVLTRAGLQAHQVDSLIFVGGSSLMAMVETAMRDMFPNAKPHRTSAFTAVVEGLVIAAGQRFT